MSNHGTYGLLYDLKAWSDALDQEDTSQDVVLQSFCETASRMIDGTARREFYPMYETRNYDMPPDDSLLKLDKDMLAVDSFTTQNGDVSLTEDTHYFLMTGNSYNCPPYDRISMKSDGARPNLLYSGTVQKSQAVTGWWGYHEDWSNAWIDSGDTLAAAISSATATSFTVSDATSADVLNRSPRFKVGQLLKIDTEYLYLHTIKSNTLYVIRGVNGTTAATHTISTSISIYKPMREIEQAALRLADWLNDLKDAGREAVIRNVAHGTVEIPESAPVDVHLIVNRFRRRML